MAPEVQAALVTGIFALILLVAGRLTLRARSKSAATLRRSLNRQEALENYVFVLRRQVNAAGRNPWPWPPDLRYLNRDDHDEQVDDEQS